MGHITNATAFRLGYVKKWVSSWTAEAKLYKIFLHQDFLIFRFMKAFFMQYSSPVFFYEPKIEEVKIEVKKEVKPENQEEKTEDKDKKEENIEEKLKKEKEEKKKKRKEHRPKSKPIPKIKIKPKTEDELEEEKANLIPITQRNKRTEAANKLSGNDTIIPSPFVDHSFTFSHLTITRSYSLGINCHFMDSLLENWRLTLLNKHTAVPSRVFRPFPIKSYLPRFLTQFKRRSRLYKFKRIKVKRRFGTLRRKFKTYNFFFRKKKQQKNKPKNLNEKLKKYRLKKTIQFNKSRGLHYRPRVRNYTLKQQQLVSRYQQNNLNKQQRNFSYQPYRLNQQKYQPDKSSQHQFNSRNQAYGLTQNQFNSRRQPYKTNQQQFNPRNQFYSTNKQQSQPKYQNYGLKDNWISALSKKLVVSTQTIKPNSAPSKTLVVPTPAFKLNSAPSKKLVLTTHSILFHLKKKVLAQNTINKKNSILSVSQQQFLAQELENLRRNIKNQSKFLIKLTLRNTKKTQELNELSELTLINTTKKRELKKLTFNPKIEKLNLIVLKVQGIKLLLSREVKKIKLLKSKIEKLINLIAAKITKIKALRKTEIEKAVSLKTAVKNQEIITLSHIRKIRIHKVFGKCIQILGKRMQILEKRIKLRKKHIKLRRKRLRKAIKIIFKSRNNRKPVKRNVVSLFKKRLDLMKNNKVTVLEDFQKNLENLAKDILKRKKFRKRTIKRQKKKSLRNEKRISNHHRKMRRFAKLRNNPRKRKYFRYKPRIDMNSKMAAYPISLYQLLLQTPKTLNLPPTTKAFKLLKILILMFPIILQTVMKKQFFYLTLFRQCLMFLLTLPFYIPKTLIFRILTMLFLKESSYKNINIYYFKKLVSSRFLIFQGAHSAIMSSLKAFDKNDKITVTFYGMHIRNLTASLVCNYIIYKLGQYFTIKEILRPLIRDFYHSKNLAGFRVIVAGRLTRKERAAYMVRRNGQITLSKKSLFIDYAADFKIMRFGVVGIKIWLNHRKFAPNFYAFKFTSYFNEEFVAVAENAENKENNIDNDDVFSIMAKV